MLKPQKIDLIQLILKKSKNWGREKEKRKLDILLKRYIYAINTNILIKQIHDLTPDFYTFS